MDLAVLDALMDEQDPLVRIDHQNPSTDPVDGRGHGTRRRRRRTR
jgi:hypothetical protein